MLRLGFNGYGRGLDPTAAVPDNFSNSRSVVAVTLTGLERTHVVDIGRVQ